MKKSVKFIIFSLLACILNSCNNKESSVELKVPPFPYQKYLESDSEDNHYLIIGDDGSGFEAICSKIRYPEMPDTLSTSQFADSLLQFYNISIAFNTLAYDVNTAEFFMDEGESAIKQADALDSINLSGIHLPEIKEALARLGRKAAKLIRSGKKPNEQKIEEVGKFYEAFNAFMNPLFDAHISKVEFNPSEIMKDYAGIHSKAISDTTTIRNELLQQVLRESDFSKKCLLAREFAYANHNSPDGDDKEFVAVIDPILRTNRYSPLLGELWLMWRTVLQKNILSGMSNDCAMYNLFYNDMRNRIAVVYIAYLAAHPNDKLAFKKFAEMAMEYNITRRGGFCNNSIDDDMSLYEELWNKDKE